MDGGGVSACLVWTGGNFGTPAPGRAAGASPVGAENWMSTTAETQEAETTTDGPLLDLTDAGVKRFIKQAKARGYVTMDELNKVLPSEEVTSEQIEDTLAMLSEMGVNVVENDEVEGDGEAGEGGEVAVREESAVT